MYVVCARASPLDARRIITYHPQLSCTSLLTFLAMSSATQPASVRLDALYERLDEISKVFVGYPVNLDFDYSHLYRFLEFSINNVGDPYHSSYFRLNTHDFEREVVAQFADLMRIEQDDAWGYVTNGGTEGNMHGVFLAQEHWPDGVLYFSQDTHYSALKIARVLRARNIMVKSRPDGEIDYDDLRETLRVYRDVPVIFFANIGTTMKGAVDDITKVQQILEDLAIRRSHIHADAALSGMILPFVDDPQPFGFDAGVDSIAISGHKMIGSPTPCGVALTRHETATRVASSVEYVGVMDTTLPGSRCAVTPLFLWSAFQQHGLDGFRDIVARCLDTAEYAIDRFNEFGIPAWRHKNSVTVVFPKPSEPVLHKWMMAPQGDIAHIITMPHVTRDHIDEVVSDCVSDDQVRALAAD